MSIGATSPALAAIQAQTQTQTALRLQSDRLVTSRVSPPIDVPSSSTASNSVSSSSSSTNAINSGSQPVARSNDPLQPNQIQPTEGSRKASTPDARSASVTITSAPITSASASSPASSIAAPINRSQQASPSLAHSLSGPSLSEQPDAVPPVSVQQDPQVQAQVRQLAQIDRDVRDHEAAHAAAGGALAGAPSFSYTRGPDGQLYATGGEVSIDTSASVDPADTVTNARAVIEAALAPASPSTQDLRVAAQARAQLIDAQAELTRNAQQAVTEERAAAGAESEPIATERRRVDLVQSESVQSESVLSQRVEAERVAKDEVAADIKGADDKEADEEEREDKPSQSSSSFQETLAATQEREARIRQSQLEFAQELALLNQRIQLVQQQLIETGEVDPASLLQGSLLDTLV